MYVRAHCPACRGDRYRLLAKMTHEYLSTGPQGWKTEEALLKLAGWDPDASPESNYCECEDCGLYYVREIWPIEGAFQKFYTHEIPADTFSSKTVISALRATEVALGCEPMVTLALARAQAEKRPPRILDYGCGRGRDLDTLRAMVGCEVVGYNHLDFVSHQIEKNCHPGVRCVYDPAELKKLGPFDAIRCNGVLEHVEDPNAVVDEIRGLLAPNGVAYFYAPMVGPETMRQYSTAIAENRKVKQMHLGHINIWNSRRFPLSKYVESRGFRIIPLERPIRHLADTSGLRGRLQFARELLKTFARFLVNSFHTLTGRHSYSMFLALKTDAKPGP